MLEVKVVVYVDFEVGSTGGLPIDMEAQITVPKPVRVADVLPLSSFWCNMPLVTVIVTPELTDKDAVLLDKLPKVMEPTVVVTFPVSVTPAGITTLSVLPGTPEGVQVAAVFQLPVDAVFVVCAFKT